jgi:hypothetical protein
MNRIETLATRVRPVKKLFIIEQDDREQLVKIITSVSKEITGLSNLILVNDDTLFSDEVVAFVNRHDPDVIVNYSSRSNDDLQKKYKIKSLTGSRSDKSVAHLSTPLYIVNNIPQHAFLEVTDATNEVFSCLDDKRDPENLMFLLHCGLSDADIDDAIEESVFKNTKVSNITSLEHFFQIVDDIDKNFLYISLPLADIGEGSSIFYLDYNPDQLFKDKPTVIFGRQDDVRSMVYFWNMRATYPYNKTIWVPVEIFDIVKDYLGDFKYYCVFSGEELVQGRLIQDDLVEFDCSKYYFGTFTREWDLFSHLQNVSIIDGKLRITHPVEKMFSTYGLNISLVLEVVGLKETHLPKSLHLGELFVSLPEKGIFPYYFARISRLKLSLYASNFDIGEASPLIEDITLPTTKEILTVLFNEAQLKIVETQGTRVADQLIDLLGGYDGIKLISNRSIFELLVKLTPPRVEKLVKALTTELGDADESEIRDLITKNIASFTTINLSNIVDIEKISSMLPISKKQRKQIYPLIQELYERKVLLRGKSFSCPYCNSVLWYSLETIREENKCYGCNQYISIPIFDGEKVLGDHFKLNELVSNAVDQGLLPLLLAVAFLYKQPYHNRSFIHNYDIFNVVQNTRLAEADLIFILGGRLGLAEIKADRGFEEGQIDRLLDSARIVNADMVLFSTLKGKEAGEIESLVSYLSSRELKIPAFILTGEILFEEGLISLRPYFEVDLWKKTFPVGPIVLTKGK